MKLTTDFSGLWANVRQMGEFEANFDLEKDVSPDFELDNELSSTTGLSIKLDDLELENGVLSVKGRQVLLFIPDHGNQIERVLAAESLGNRFHVADCDTLNRMRKNNRFNRYKATYNVSGKFGVYGTSYETGTDIEGEAELKVCKNCLSYLNYKGYQSGLKRFKSSIFKTFDIAEFLSEYSTLFHSMPDRSAVVDKGGYSDDWTAISTQYRASVGFRCEQCKVDLNSKKSLLHTHHVSGNKRENHPTNLKALCIDCHRKQPHHDYMRVAHSDMVLINQLRSQQGVLQTSNWQEARKMADKALDGLMRYYEKEDLPVPEVGYELTGPNQSVVARLEVAWPSKKFGVAINSDDIAAACKLGWKVMSVGKALEGVQKRK